AAVEPYLVAAVARSGEEVAHREVLHADATPLEDRPPVAAEWLTTRVGRSQVLRGRRGVAGRRTRFRPVHDHLVAVHAAQVDVRSADQHPAAGGTVGARMRVVAPLVIVARGDQYPVSGLGRIDGVLNGRIVPDAPV